jgi:hypothetical protein
MRVTLRASSRQVLLFPGAAGNEDLGAINKPDLIDALADLLLEALGEERDEEGDDDESQDHR